MTRRDTLQWSSEWSFFKNGGLDFIYLKINGLLSKIKELRYIEKCFNAVVLGICESKLKTLVLEQEMSIDKL